MTEEKHCGDSVSQPDILIDYPESELSYIVDSGQWETTAYSMIYVRPETNRIQYEGSIINGLKNHGDVIYMANFNGSVFLNQDILKGHYPSQFRFAISPREEMAKYPEMIDGFENHFGVRFSDARIMGSFAAVFELGMNEEEFFGLIVPERDFLNMFGQTFKKVGDIFIVNYDLPALINRYVCTSDVFVILVKSNRADQSFFDNLNHSIYDEIVSHKDTPILYGDKLDSLHWYDKIKRTYHISSSHIMTMFDMADFVFKSKNERIRIDETPLGRTLVSSGDISAEDLCLLKNRQVCYGQSGDIKNLFYLPLAGRSKDFNASRDLLKSCCALL